MNQGRPPASPLAGPARPNDPQARFHVEQPAVAGLFYPSDRGELSSLLDQLLREAAPPPVGRVRALICPHAGYRYSGLTAAFGYKLLLGTPIHTAIVLAPSHYASFQGASVLDAESFKTPLGLTPVSPVGRLLAAQPPFALERPEDVQRPGWWAQSSRKAPPVGQDTPHTWEHADEVQVPFLQKVLPDAQVLSIILGQVNLEAVAAGLIPHLDPHTLLVASSDLSHFKSYDRARAIDQATVQTILSGDAQAASRTDACGRGPIGVVLHVAKALGWKPVLLDLRNSGDTAGDKARVVGYAAIALIDPQAPPEETRADAAAPEDASSPDLHSDGPVAASPEFSHAERAFLLELARKCVTEVTQRGQLPALDEESVPPRLRQERGVFVTLTKRGRLRGCIGHIVPREPLYLAVMDNARAAAQQDPRFSPVRAQELAELHVEVSVLTEPRPLAFRSPEELLARLRPGVDGVVLKLGRRQSTFLPQVWEQLPEKETFLEHLSEKAGAAPWAWREPGTQVQIYQVEAFEEED